MKRLAQVQILRRTLVALAVASCFVSGSALANPTAPTVVGGTATFQQAGNLLTVTNSPSAIINWVGFSIGASEITRFVQQSQQSSVLNRVVGQDPSNILGSLQSNGRVFLINPNGILFGQGAQIDVAGLVASSLNLSNADFLAGRLNFTETAGAGSVVNQGNITTDAGGSVYLVAPDITNSGVITTPKGEVVLAAGKSVELVDPGTPDLRVNVTASDEKARNLGQIVAESGRIGIYAGLINHSGTIRADSAVMTEDGRIVLKAMQGAAVEAGSVTSASGPNGGALSIQSDSGVVAVGGTAEARGNSGLGGQIAVSGDGVVNTARLDASGSTGGEVHVETRNYLGSGAIHADGTAGAGGLITVAASAGVIQTSAELLSARGSEQGGRIVVNAGERIFSSGTLDASGGRGGETHVLAPAIMLYGARVDASGDAAGGIVLVGGDYRGGNPAVPNASTTWINYSTDVRADAKATGAGGRVIVWSEKDTRFGGTISVRGGAQSGNGGFVEVSGRESLVFAGTANAAAPNGVPGSVLLDPKNIVIDAAATGPISTFQLVDPHPAANENFGTNVTVLPNDNVVVADPNDSFAAAGAGATYLFNGMTGALISTITGSATGDGVGSSGVIPLAGVNQNNFLVSSPSWNGSRGAVTWGDGAAGFVGGGGAVSSSNSLVGTTPGDQVGGPTPVCCDIPTLASAIGGSVVPLTNGNYVVASPFWSNGTAAAAGAVTFGNGASGVLGAVSASNSLVGATANDWIGSSYLDFVGSPYNGVTALTNGNYVVASPFWSNGTATQAGAVTFGNGTSGISGAVTAFNSLIGATGNDRVGGSFFFDANNNLIVVSNSPSVVALTNGNYVVASPLWSNGTASGTGAVTFGNGTSGISGEVSASNSLVGTTANDQVGAGGISVGNPLVPFSRPGAFGLSNGNYVVLSPVWNNGTATQAGAATFGNGTSGVSGAVSSANSLVGTTANDSVGSDVRWLNNGNYVVTSPYWSNGIATSAGAVTFGNGTGGVSGAVSASNSLVGTTAGDLVGGGYGTSCCTYTGGVFPLANGNYVVASPNWNNGTATLAGAVTLGNGASGISGAVSASNSLVGTTANDQVGVGGINVGNGFFAGGVFALSNGNFVVLSPFWNNGTTTQAGAVTFGNGTNGISGAVSASNSLVGTMTNDRVGSGRIIDIGGGDVLVYGGVFELANSNYVVTSPNWSNGGAAPALGAATFGSGTTGISGAVSASNSLVGTAPFDQVGRGVRALNNGNYVVASPFWSNGTATAAGAVTFGNGTSGISGAVSASNSLVGTTANDRVGYPSSFGGIALTNGNYVVVSPNWNNGTATQAGAVTFGNGTSGISGAVSASNSLVGTTAGDQVGGPFNVTALSNGNYMVASPNWSNGTATAAGAVTFGNGTSGISGAVSASNSLVGTTANDRIGSGYVDPQGTDIFLVSSPSAANGAMTGAGLVHVVVTTLNPLTFYGFPSVDATITPAQITAITNTGTAVTLQANNDITLAPSSPIATSADGAGGVLTMQAGRSIAINSSIWTDNGNLTLIANDPNALQAYRDAGSGGVSVAGSVYLNTGSANLTIAAGAGDVNIVGEGTYLSGDNITLSGANIYLGNSSNFNWTSLVSSGSILLDAALDPLSYPSLPAANGDIKLAHTAITKTAGTDATLDIRANNSITLSGSTANSLGAKFNVVLNADRDADGTGQITLGADSVLTSNGGDVTLGGGVDPSAGYAVGTQSQPVGVLLSGATIDAGAGNVVIRGRGRSGDAGGIAPTRFYGVEVTNGSVIQTSTGAIDIEGIGGDSTGFPGGYNRGIYVVGLGTRISTSEGNISLTGWGGNSSGVALFDEFGEPVELTDFGNNRGIVIYPGAVIETKSLDPNRGAITLWGRGGNAVAGGGNSGLYLEDYLQGTAVRTVNGRITLYGEGGTTSGADAPAVANNGISLGAALIQTTAGDISITGVGGTSATTSTQAAHRGILVQGFRDELVDEFTGQVYIDTQQARIQTTNGSIVLVGTGGHTSVSGGDNDGVYLSLESSIRATGTGTIEIIGRPGTSTEAVVNPGLKATGTNITVATGTGALTLRAAGDFVVGDLVQGGQAINLITASGPQTIEASGSLALTASGGHVNLASGGTQAIAVEGDVSITGGTGTNEWGMIKSIGDQTISSKGITLTAGVAGGGLNTGNFAIIRGNANQNVSVGNGGIHIVAGGGTLTDNTAQIYQAGGAGTSQAITVSDGGAITLKGGSSAMNNVGGLGHGSRALIEADGDSQTISFTNGGSIDLTGGTLGSRAYAIIYAMNGSQTIAGSPSITLTGGASGGIVGEGNRAGIFADIGPQSITANSMTLRGGVGGIDNNASISTAGGQSITVGSGGMRLFGGGGDPTAVNNIASVTQNSADGDQIVTVTGGGIEIVGGPSGSNSYARIRNFGLTQTISAESISLTGGADGGGFGTGNRAMLQSSGDQTISVGAGGLTLTGGGGSLSDNAAMLEQLGAVGTQTINVNGGSIVLTGGSSAGTDVGGRGHGSRASIYSEGTEQQVNFIGTGSLTLTGGTVGSRNFAQVWAENGSQTITGSPFITLTGGASGGIDGEGNYAVIGAKVGSQSMDASGIMLMGGASGIDNYALILAQGSQILSLGNAGLTLIGGGGIAAENDNFALIHQAGSAGTSQVITVGAGGAVTLQGGSGAAQSVGFNNGSFAAILADGESQLIDFALGGALRLIGGTIGSNNRATIYATNGAQTIQGSPDITLIGGASGGIEGEGNGAGIYAESGLQTIAAGNVTLTAGAGGLTNAAYIQAPEQEITVHGDLSLAGGGSANGTVFGGGAGLGGRGGNSPTVTALNLRVDGNLSLIGGSASDASIGSGYVGGQPTTISIDVGGDMTISGGTSPGGGAWIGTPSWNISGGDIAAKAGGGIAVTRAAGDLRTGIFTTGNVVLTARNISLDPDSVGSAARTVLNASELALAGSADYSRLAINATNSVSLTSADPVVVPALVLAGPLTVTAGGAITQAGALVVGGGATFDAGANPVTLDAVTNDFIGAVSATAGSTWIADINELTLGTVATGSLTVSSSGALNLGQGTVGGNLAATSNGGAISQSGGLTVTGTSNLNAGANTITLTQATNDFQGATSLTNSGANAVQIADANGIDLGTSTVGQDLNVTAGGAITQSGVLTVPGTASFSAGSNPITLANAGNDFQGAVGLTGGATQITDANALVLGTVATGDLAVSSTGALNLGQGTVGGNLVATSNGGAITQSGDLTVSGTSNVNAGANTITLTSAGNDYQGAVSLTNSSANDVTVANSGTLTLTSSNIGGNFAVESTGGSLVVSGATTVGGNARLSAADNLSFAAPLTAGGNISLSAGNTTTVSDTSVSTSGSLSANTGALEIVANSSPTSLIAGSNLDVSAGDVTLQGGTVDAASAELRAGPGTFSLATTGDVTLTGGSGSGAYARIYGDPDVSFVIGGTLNFNAGTGAGSFAAVEAASANTIWLDFPNLASGGFFVNGIEGLIYDPVTLTGFFAGGLPAVLGQGLQFNYGQVSPNLAPLLTAQIVGVQEASLTTTELVEITQATTDTADVISEGSTLEERPRRAPACR